MSPEVKVGPAARREGSGAASGAGPRGGLPAGCNPQVFTAAGCSRAPCHEGPRAGYQVSPPRWGRRPALCPHLRARPRQLWKGFLGKGGPLVVEPSFPEAGFLGTMFKKETNKRYKNGPNSIRVQGQLCRGPPGCAVGQGVGHAAVPCSVSSEGGCWRLGDRGRRVAEAARASV